MDVLVFLALRGAFDARLLDLIWRASLDKHESVKQAIYACLIDLTPSLSLPLVRAPHAPHRTAGTAPLASRAPPPRFRR